MEHQTDFDISELIEDLSHDDRKKILFLLIDDLHVDSYCSLIGDPELSTSRFPIILTHYSSNPRLSRNLMIEALSTIKKYKSLKRFGVCKHQRNIITSEGIPKFRKFLFSICEELTDDDLLQFCDSPHLVNIGCRQILKLKGRDTAESLMSLLLTKEWISEENSLLLKDIFEDMYRTDLLEKYNQFYGTVSLNSSNEETSSVGGSGSVSLNSSGEETSTGSSSSDFDLDDEPVMVYPMVSPTPTKKSGFAIIVNQEKFKSSPKRLGTREDRDNIDKVLTDFGLYVNIYENLSAANIKAKFSELAQMEYKDCSIFVAFLLSHGEGGDVIRGSDDKPVVVQSLVEKMANDCKSLLKVPKLFFVQACKGKDAQKGIPVDDSSDYQLDGNSNLGALKHIPRLCDTFVAYSTVEGYASFRSPKKGSIFIQRLCRHLRKYGDKEDIAVIMKRVIYEIAKLELKEKEKQMPEYRSTLQGIVKFKKVN